MASSRYSLNKNKYLLEPEVQRLRILVADHESRDPRNCFLLSLGFRTGARATELLNIQKADLNPYDETVLIRGIKGSSDRELPLESRFFQRFHLWSEKQSGAKIFSITYDRLYQIWDLYRPVPKKFHSLRHTFAIELYQKTKDLRLVQFALGHRNITNTMIYAEYHYNQTELKKLILY